MACTYSNEISQTSSDLKLMGWQRRLFVSLISFSTLCLFFHAGHSVANPQDGQVVAGDITISSSDQRLDIIQRTDKGIVDWRGFSIDPGEHTNFSQPSSSSVTLNRVTGSDFSNIDGQLTANGRLFLVNPNGVLFGPNSKVSVGSLVATTSNLPNDKFLSDDYSFNQPSSDPNASVVNQGEIQVTEGGAVVLAAPRVSNEGSIHARLGRVELAGAETFTVDFDGDGLLTFQLGDSVTQAPEVAEGETAALVTNNGEIFADGGVVTLSARTADAVVDRVINMEGVIQAQAVEQRGGVIILSGGDEGIVSVSGSLDASGAEPSQIGGTIKVLGEKISLFANTEIDASGQSGGGEVLIGGNFQGNGPEPNATHTYVDAETKINADAVVEGDGGRVIVWADDTTEFHGNIRARGGEYTGNGGFAEISGKKHLAITGHADLFATNGQSGMLLLDPGSVTIVDGPSTGPTGSLDTFNDAWIEDQLIASDLMISTNDSTNDLEENIYVSPDVSITWVNSNFLELIAGHDIYLDGTFIADTGTLLLTFGQDGTGGRLLMDTDLSMVETVKAVGGDGSDTLVAANVENKWNIMATNSGYLDGNGIIVFTDVENLIGGTSNDIFTFGTTGSLMGGLIDGQTGTDTLAGISSCKITGENSGYTSFITDVDFTNIENLIGTDGTNEFYVVGGTLSGMVDGLAGMDSLRGDSSYSITGTDSGSSGSVNAFANIENLFGSDGDVSDSFMVNGGTLSGTANGLGGTDTLSGDSSYNITDINSGTSASVSNFFSIENLTGTGENDSFILNGGTLSGMANGLGGTDTLAGDNNYRIMGLDSGASNSVSQFVNIENLTGTAGDDTFTFLPGSSLSGLIRGLAEMTADTVDYSALLELTLNLGTKVSDIEYLHGGGDGFTLVNGNNWNITGADDGIVDGITFTNWENIYGTENGDIFTVNAAFSGVMDGSVGNDQFNLNDGVTTLIGGAGIDTVNIVSSFTILGNITIIAESIGDSGAGIVLGADALTLNGASLIGTSGNPLGTDLTKLVVSDSTGDAFIAESNSIDLSGIDVGFSIFSLTAGGNITGSEDVTVGGTANFTADGFINITGPIRVGGVSSFTASESITLTNLDNDFIGAISLNNSGVNDVAVTDSNLLTIGVSNLGNGALTIQANGINQTGEIIQQSNNVASTTIDAGDGSIDLPLRNIFTGLLDISNSGNNDVYINNPGGLIQFNSLNVGSGSLTVVALPGINVGSFTQESNAGLARFVASIGPIDLSGITNNFTGPISLLGGSATLFNNSEVVFETSSILFGSLYVIGEGISQIGDLTVTGPATFNAGTNPVTLDLDNDFSFGPLTINNTGNNDVQINDVNTIEFGSLNVGSGILIVNAQTGISAGNFTQEANAGLATFSTDQGPINLSGMDNSITGPLALFTQDEEDVTVFNNNAVMLALSNLGSGSFNVTGDGISQTGALTIAGPATFDAGTSPITLTDAENRFFDNVSLISTGSSDVQITTADSLTLTTSILGSGQSTIQAGDLTLVGSVQGTGSLFLQPFGLDQDIGLGEGIGSYNLSNADLGQLTDGFSMIQIGANGMTGRVTIDNATFTDPLVIQADGVGASILINDSLFGDDNASITLNGSGASTLLHGDIITSGNPIIFNDTVQLISDVLLDSTNSGSVSGGDITLNGSLVGPYKMSVQGGFFSNQYDAPLNLGSLHIISTGDANNGAQVFGVVDGLDGRYAAGVVEMEGGIVDPDFMINGCVMGIPCEGLEQPTYVDVPLNVDVILSADILAQEEQNMIAVWFQQKTLEDPRDSRYSNMGNEELWRDKKTPKSSEGQ